MTNLKNNFHRKYQDKCSRCLHEPDEKNIYSALVHNSVPYIKSTELQIIMKYLKMT